MPTLTIKLTQHTPLIHFQHDQEGATLRASEVKPKLDKFVLTKLGEGDYQAGFSLAKQKGWIVGKGDHPALDYKMRIVTQGKPKEYLVASLLNPKTIIADDEEIKEWELPFQILRESPFFAQEDVNADTNPEKAPVFYKRNTPERKVEFVFNQENWDTIGKKGLMWDDITMSLYSADQYLIEKLDSFLSEFLICTNFGTRSTKGFGSFTRQNSKVSTTCALANNFRFVYSKQINSKYDLVKEIFKNVKADYQAMKAGVNFPNYSKSILFCYAIKKMNQNPRWEKRFIKRAVKDKMGQYTRLYDKHHAPIMDCQGNSSWEDPTEFYYQFLRILLGFAEQFEFILEYKTREGEWKRDNKKKLVVRPTIEGIARYASPILFKIIDGTIYLVGNDVDSRILNKKVKLEYSIGPKSVPVDEKNKTIMTPATFHLSDFMDFAMGKEFNLGYTKVK